MAPFANIFSSQKASQPSNTVIAVKEQRSSTIPRPDDVLKDGQDLGPPLTQAMLNQSVLAKTPSNMERFPITLRGGAKTGRPGRGQIKLGELDALMTARWGNPGSPTHELVMRYWRATRTEQHWERLYNTRPADFAKYLKDGYLEPIPTAWVDSGRLAFEYILPTNFENPAEERLYYILNSATMPDGSTHPPLRPLNMWKASDRLAIIERGNARNSLARPLDAKRLAAYASKYDVFRSDKQIQSLEYSPQVSQTVYDARRTALHDLAEGILHGTDHLETMLLLDVSGSMLFNPHSGIVGPDGIMRKHDQPRNIELVQHLVQRVLQHMVPRAQREHPQQTGIDTVTFSTKGRHIGQLSSGAKFHRDWHSKVKLGGGTQIMRGWQTVKKTYFERMHAQHGHGYQHPVFGWQWTSGMPKLSLLVFLDGEANDMDEFELELLGETWAYITVALVGMEGCPHHHSHAIELERVSKFNPHVAFIDVHGRVCERMFVEDLLRSVYPVDPPTYEEVLRPELDRELEELPAYSKSWVTSIW